MRDAARLATRMALFLALNAGLGWAVLAAHEATLPRYAPWETDSRLLLMPRDTRFDTAFLGTSHAYLFSRFEANHAITEAELGRTVFNMALPTGGGVRPARLYFDEFLARGNRCDTLVYFLDPFVLFSSGPNDAHKFIWFEPFHLRFFLRLTADRYPHAQLITYVRSKFGPHWLFQRPEPLHDHPSRLVPEDVDPERVRLRLEGLYYQGVSEAHFRRYREEFLRIARACADADIRLVVIVPPTLLGPEPGAAMALDWLREARAAHPFEVHDLVDAMREPEHYYNLDHLNTEGVRAFMRRFVAPILAR